MDENGIPATPQAPGVREDRTERGQGIRYDVIIDPLVLTVGQTTMPRRNA
jgi:hypothetical protein